MSNKQRTIIIMRPEDNKANSLIHKLKKNPHKLLLETIGETIPERIHKLNIDLLILFHIENFPQICKEIKDSPFLRDVPVLIFDNKPSEKRQLMAYKSGASDYIFEPILEETITLKVQNFLNTSQSIRQLESELSLSKFDKALNKLLEQELLLFSQIVEQSANSIMVTDLEGKIKFINTSFTDVTGYTFNEIIGKNSRILKSGKTPPGIYVDLWDTIKSGKIWSGELLNRKKNGELIWESVNITPLKDQNGITNNYLAINMDITEKKKYEEQIRESEESFRALSESQFEGIIVHKNNIILEINFAITSLFGYERDELFGSNLSTLFTKESYRKLLKEKAEESYELEGIRKDGSIFPLEIRAKDIPYMGSIVRIAAIRDITKLKTAMKEIQEQKNKLVESYLEAESLLLNILPEK
ncbi:MAG: PAS domain S-box protein, partial [Leptospiraceae bacterium]|nr:PAS domain S-box protein [Leptospiraceae bacterium]